MAEIIYLNDKLVPRARARISVFDWGFLYGYGLFETMRAYRGEIFLLERHLKRLMDSAQVIGLGPALVGIDLGKACYDTLRANNLDEARLRLTVSGGETDAFPWVGGGGTPTVVVTARPYTPFPAEKYEQGFRVGIASLRRPRHSPVSRLKSTSYLTSVLARMEAAAHGLDEALLLNEDGCIAEGGGCNVFFVRKSGLVAPSLDSGILPGITRGVVMELAKALGIGVREGDLRLSDLGHFDEAFVTNAIIGLMPLVAVKGEKGQDIVIGDGRPGKITKSLMAAYKEMVERETG